MYREREGGREKDKEKIRHFEEVRTGKARTVSERSPRPELSQFRLIVCVN